MHTQDKFLAALKLEDSGVPIYVQLREQVLAAIASGLLKPGDQMPTMRQVAIALKIDLNTVRHAYEDLGRRKAVVLVRGRGSFVAGSAALPSETPPALDRLARQTLAAARAHGVDVKTLAHRLIELATDKED